MSRDLLCAYPYCTCVPGGGGIFVHAVFMVAAYIQRLLLGFRAAVSVAICDRREFREFAECQIEVVGVGSG